MRLSPNSNLEGVVHPSALFTFIGRLLNLPSVLWATCPHIAVVHGIEAKFLRYHEMHLREEQLELGT